MLPRFNVITGLLVGTRIKTNFKRFQVLMVTNFFIQISNFAIFKSLKFRHDFTTRISHGKRKQHEKKSFSNLKKLRAKVLSTQRQFARGLDYRRTDLPACQDDREKSIMREEKEEEEDREREREKVSQYLYIYI